MPIIPVPGKLRKKDFKFFGQPGYIARPKNEKKKSGASELLVKYLPHKHGELSLVPQYPWK